MDKSLGECPGFLYKYFAPDRVDVLDRALVRYSPLGAFNDPFEGRPEITALSPDAEAHERFGRLLPQEVRRVCEQFAVSTQRNIPAAQFETLLAKMLSDSEPKLLERLRQLTPMVSGFLNRKFDELLGAFCLSEIPDNLLMWSHYAMSHTGFVVEFDAHHEYFHAQRSAEDEFRHLRRVLYRDTRPSAALTALDGFDFFLVKSSHWGYEREWRILRALEEAKEVISSLPFAVHLFSFPRDAVKSVILGARTAVPVEAAVRKALRSHAGYEKVQLKRACADDSHFLLRIEHVAT